MGRGDYLGSVRDGGLEGALFEVSQVFDIALGAAHGRVVQTHDAVAQAGGGLQEIAQHALMDGGVAHDALLPNVLAPRLELRLYEADHRRALAQQRMHRGQHEAHRNET